MNYKSFLASITVFFIAPNYLMEIHNDVHLKDKEIVNIFSESILIYCVVLPIFNVSNVFIVDEFIVSVSFI